jgi:hypothetical protein
MEANKEAVRRGGEGDADMSTGKEIYAQRDWCEAAGHPSDALDSLVASQPALCVRMEGASVCAYCIMCALLDELQALKARGHQELPSGWENEGILDCGEPSAWDELLTALTMAFEKAAERRNRRETVEAAIQAAEAIVGATNDG